MTRSASSAARGMRCAQSNSEFVVLTVKKRSGPTGAGVGFVQFFLCGADVYQFLVP
jgi:hypothetical protein